jgi:hypothetical protein
MLPIMIPLIFILAEAMPVGYYLPWCIYGGVGLLLAIIAYIQDKRDEK